MNTELLDFIHGLRWAAVPAPVQRRVRLLVADVVAVSVAGRPAPAARIAADHASAVYAGAGATSLFDGRPLGPVGAAWANAVLANALDLDDGHRLTKGHPGAMVVPAALALAESRDLGLTALLEAVAVGYEVAIRAGIALHRRDAAYHASGAWGAIGVAAAAARLLELDRAATAHALGLAEYHGPIAPIMRSCADPAMTKDACDVGARAGVEAALLAARGFTSVGSQCAAEMEGELGTRWRLQEVYVKAHPCCRWTQGAIRGALRLAREPGFSAPAVRRIEIRTFAAADGLSKRVPTDTEQAQYNIVWPVAAALVHGTFGVAQVLGPFDDPRVTALLERTEVVVDPELTAAFPGRRLTVVRIETVAGATSETEPLEARGEPEDADWEEIVLEKVRSLIGPSRPSGGTTHSADGGPDGLAGIGLDRLVGLLAPADAPAR